MAPRVTKEENARCNVEALFALYYEPIDIKQWEAGYINIFTDPDWKRHENEPRLAVPSCHGRRIS